MNNYFYRGDKIILSLAVILFFLSIGIVCFNRHRMRRMTARMNHMLEVAINGEFSEEIFDESLLSALESKLAEYLLASTVSSGNFIREKEKIKELIADISHQIKTPVANMLLYAQLLEEQELSKEGKECVNALCVQIDKLNFLIASLVKISRLEAGVFVLHPVKNSLGTMLREIQMQYAPIAKEKDIRLLVEDTKKEAVFDRKWTTEALANLVDNAIKYTPSGGEIRVSIEEYELFCRINVADNGIGIREEEHAKVFGRFYRSQEVSEIEGVGIGLYLTRQILSKEGGYIRLSSSKGQDTEFSIFLPR